MSRLTNPTDFILQRDVRGEVIPRIGREPWVTIHDELGWASGIYSALVPEASVPEVIATPAWELHKGDGGREVYRNDEHGHSYERLSSPHGVEPIVWVRSYDGVRPAHLELSEEYRLFHNLFHDRDRGEFVRITDDGAEEVVGRIQGMRCELRLRDIRQYLAIRRMYLAVYFQVWRESEIPVEQLPADEAGPAETRDDLTCYEFEAFEDPANKPGIKTVSKTIGKKLVRPVALESCGIWPYEATETYESFVIDTNEDGRNVEHTCDPDALANYFGKNPGAPHYLTPVFFRRAVLTRYFANPSKYAIQDGRLRCASLWSLKIDNNHADLVCVALGDLGRELPNGERPHWRAHNVPPDGAGISEVNFRRNFLGEWTDAEAPDLVFKAMYERLHEPWEARFGWQLFRPLHEADAHCLGALRRLLAEEQAEFDDQVKNLTKLLVDALNDEAIQSALPSKVKDEKSIAKLARWLTQEGQPNAAAHVVFLRDLQAIRSRGAAHSKGSGYEELWKRLGYEGRPLAAVFDEILARAARTLDELRTWAEASVAVQTPEQGEGDV